MEIRQATTEDFAAIQVLIAQYPEKLLQDHLPQPEEFFVAIADDPSTSSGQVVGCCALEVYSQRLAEVRSLAVVKEFQRKGIATQLIERCLQEARAKNVFEVLAITGANALFEKHGFGTFKDEKYALIKVLS